MIETPETVDVAVVGYGPVGMATAALLGAAGHHVVVLERYAGLYNLPRAAIFDDETMRTLARLGVAEELLPKLHVQRNYEWRNAEGELLIEHDFAATGRCGWAEWYMMYQPELEDALDRRAPRRRRGGPIRQPGEGVARPRRPRRAPGRRPRGPRRVRARWVIACDGGNSFVRSALGLARRTTGSPSPGWCATSASRRHAATVPTARQVGDPAGSPPRSSRSARRTTASATCSTRSRTSTSSATPRRSGRGSPAGSPATTPSSSASPPTRSAPLVTDRWRVGRVLLAGDAAHQMPPFLGQGMCSGIRDAQNLAFKLDASCGAGSPTTCSTPTSMSASPTSAR